MDMFIVQSETAFSDYKQLGFEYHGHTSTVPI